jgi:sugar (pentulose or hexulose) kinase
VEEACRATIEVVQEIPPIAQNVAIYEKFYPVYRALYPALKPQYDAVTAAVAETV